METRQLGKSGMTVSPMGLGCWAIGGQFYFEGVPDGWGQVDDAESIRAIQRALDLGVTFLDTSDAYGVGHSEEIIGRALAGRRHEAVIATKFGYFGSEATKTLQGINLTPAYIERACEASLRRLQTDCIDLYQLHVWEAPLSTLSSVWEALDRLVEKGKIKAYGWSTDLPESVKLYADRRHFTAVQQQLNIFEGSLALLRACEENRLASINRSPLAMGLLTGKFDAGSRLPKDDVRGAGFSWCETLFKDGKPAPAYLDKLEAINDILKSGGRTLAQGALAWLWAKSPASIPIPGFKTVRQVEENARAMEFGPLTGAQMREIEEIMDR